MNLAGATIRRDDAGRYNLNDLHAAAGGEARHKPGNWLMLVATAELIAELAICCDSSNKPVAAERGRYGGTVVCKELVYAYAMWVSASARRLPPAFGKEAPFRHPWHPGRSP